MNNNEGMKNLLTILLLIPMFSFGDFDYDQPLDEDPVIENKDDQQRIENIKYSCSIESGHAKNEYSAKKIYDNCLKVNGIKK